MRSLLGLLITLALIGCGDGSEGEPLPAEELETAPPEAAAAAVVLQAGGLEVSDAGETGRALEFAADREAVTGALTEALGAPSTEEADMECGPGTLDAMSWDGLDVYFLDSEFAGWYLQDPQPVELTTPAGIGLGSTRAELEESHDDVSVEASSLGTEWMAGGLSGTLAGDDEDAQIETLWAGATCIAR